MNHVMMSYLWYFIAVWVGSKRVLEKIKALFRNYLWHAYENTARARVSWDDYTVGGQKVWRFCIPAEKKRVMSAIF